MSKRYTGKTFYCKHCGGVLSMFYQDNAKWVPILHQPFDCIDEIAHYVGINIPPGAV